MSNKKSRFVCRGFAHGEPASPISESLAIIELSSHSSGEGTSDSGAPELDGDWDIRKKSCLPEASSSGTSADSSSMAALTAI